MNNIVDYIQERIETLRNDYLFCRQQYNNVVIAELQAVLSKIEELKALTDFHYWLKKN